MSKYIIQAPIRSHIAQEQDMKNQWIPTDQGTTGTDKVDQLIWISSETKLFKSAWISVKISRD
jgi:hypothetical protein